MKRLLITVILIFVVVGCSSNTSIVNARNGVYFGMTMDEVKELETEGIFLNEVFTENISRLFYSDIRYEDFFTTIQYFFNSDGLLVELSYQFDINDANKRNFDSINTRLIGIYGEPLPDDRVLPRTTSFTSKWELKTNLRVTLSFFESSPISMGDGHQAGDPSLVLIYNIIDRALLNRVSTNVQDSEPKVELSPIMTPEPEPILLLTVPHEPDWNMYISNTETEQRVQLFTTSLIDNLGEGETDFIPFRPESIFEQTITYTYGATVFDEDFGLVVTRDSGWINKISNNVRVGLCLGGNWIFNDFLVVGTYISEVIDKFGEGKVQSADTRWEIISYYLDENGIPTDIKNAKVWLDVKFNPEENFVREYELGIFSIRGGRNAIVPYLVNEEHVSIDYIYSHSPSSADGVDLSVAYRNNNSETIKYIYFTVTPYNAVGDAVNCTIRNRSTVTVEITGPISSDMRTAFTNENLWYNANIKSAILESVRIIYMNGEEVTLKVER